MEDVEVKTRFGRARKLSDKVVQFAMLKDKADPWDGLADGVQCVLINRVCMEQPYLCHHPKKYSTKVCWKLSKAKVKTWLLKPYNTNSIVWLKKTEPNLIRRRTGNALL